MLNSNCSKSFTAFLALAVFLVITSPGYCFVAVPSKVQHPISGFGNVAFSSSLMTLSSTASPPNVVKHDANIPQWENYDQNTVHVIENLKHLFSFFDGSEQERDCVKLKEAFDKVFDKNLRALTYPPHMVATINDIMDPNKRVELGYEGFYEAIKAYYMKGTKNELISLEIRHNGDIEFYQRLLQRGHLVDVRTIAKTRNGKIVHYERQDTTIVGIEKFKHFVSLFDDGSDDFDREKFYREFEKVFDKSATLMTFKLGADAQEMQDFSNRIELKFDEIFERLTLGKRKQQRPYRVMYIRPMDGGRFEFASEQEANTGHEGATRQTVTIHGHARTNAEGKITHMERDEMNKSWW